MSTTPIALPPPPDPNAVAAAVPSVQKTTGEKVWGAIGSRAEAVGNAVSGLSGAPPRSFDDTAIGKALNQHYQERLADARNNYSTAQMYSSLAQPQPGAPYGVDSKGNPLTPQQQQDYKNQAKVAMDAWQKAVGVTKETKAAAQQKRGLFDAVMTHGAHAVGTALQRIKGGGGAQPAAASATASPAPAGQQINPNLPPPPPPGATPTPQDQMQAAIMRQELAANAPDNQKLAIYQRQQDILAQERIKEEQAQQAAASEAKIKEEQNKPQPPAKPEAPVNLAPGHELVKDGKVIATAPPLPRTTPKPAASKPSPADKTATDAQKAVVAAQKEYDAELDRYNRWRSDHYLRGTVAKNPYEDSLAEKRDKLNKAKQAAGARPPGW